MAPPTPAMAEAGDDANGGGGPWAPPAAPSARAATPDPLLLPAPPGLETLAAELPPAAPAGDGEDGGGPPLAATASPAAPSHRSTAPPPPTQDAAPGPSMAAPASDGEYGGGHLLLTANPAPLLLTATSGQGEMDGELGADGVPEQQATAGEVGVPDPVDWDALQIIETIDDEGRLEVASDEQLYAVLGFTKENCYCVGCCAWYACVVCEQVNGYCPSMLVLYVNK
ncbi:hypothetical protein ACP70R_000931 [Stipagrostis hirtigluma subsp. patula]